MPLLSFFQACSEWAPLVFIRDSRYGMPAVQSVHLLGLTVFLATVVARAIRLSGLGMLDWSRSFLARQLRPWAMAAVTLVLLSGLVIFLATPGKYLGSNPFRLKMALLSLAILFHLGVLRRFMADERAGRGRRSEILVACVSVTLWFSVGWAGRAIAFVP
jgi:hypothetical protein